MKRMVLYAMIAVLAGSLYSCKSSRQPEQPKAETASDGLRDKQWKLVEIQGRPVTASEAHILFNVDGTVSGSLGCNTFYGNYTALQESRIRFSNLSNTLKMCMDMTVEDDLKRALEIADSYQLTDRQLILTRARMAPLARFEVVSK
ncbi:MAG: META domain-containing protein [Dysgonamonadaceae bacterium]|jgi:heat shock protein HslJ|nr:META domain-containing protein [Dysgonamonadaceae bacterium]